MTRPSVAFIGAGRLATALALRLHEVGYSITGIYARRREAAQDLADRVGAEVSETYPQAEIIFLSVSDDALVTVVSDIAQHKIMGAVVHNSGVHDLSILAPLSAAGYEVGSFHPLYPFSAETRLKGDEGMLIGIEASSSALANQLAHIARDIGGQPALLKSGEKARYHAAAAMASNYLVTLFDMSLDLMRSAGVDEELASVALGGLMRGTLDNLSRLSPDQALTGPIARGDVETIQKHVAALGDDPAVLAAYQALGQVTVALAPNLSDNTRQQLYALLRLNAND